MKLNWISTRSKCSGYKHWGKLKKKKSKNAAQFKAKFEL